MSRLIVLTRTDDERAALEKGARHGPSHAFRTRCRMILLKAERLPSAQVAEQVGCCMMSVNGWVTRYRAEGISGLKTKSGRGRRAILDDQADLQQVRAAVQSHRQKLSLGKAELEVSLGKAELEVSLGKAELEVSLGKKFSAVTLKRFLKNIAAATSE